MASIFSKIKQTYHLLKQVDLDQLNHIAQKVDLGEIMQTVGKMNDKQLKYRQEKNWGYYSN